MSILQTIKSLNVTQLQNIIGEMCSNNTETNITVTYDEINRKLNFIVPADTNTFCEEASYDIQTKKVTFKKNDNSTFELDLAALANRANHTGTQAINTISDLESSLNGKEDKIAAKIYVDASDTDIKTVIDNWQSATILSGYNYQLHGNYAGANITIDDYYNISFSGTDNPAGSPHTVFDNRSLTLTGSNCTRIKMTNINVKNGLIVNGTQGRHYFEKCVFGGLTVSSTTNWISFIDCTFSGPITINSNFAGTIYFIRCSFEAQTLTLNNTSSTQIVLSDCSGLSSIPANAFKSGLNVLSSGAGSYYLNNVPLGTASTKNVGTSANNVIALDNNSKLPAIDGSQLTNLPSNWVLSGNNIYNSNSGNVGINTTNPTGILHALGEENQTIQFKIESPSSSGPNSFIHMGIDTSIAYIQTIEKPLVFYLGQERMRVTPSGDVGINTPNPSYRLHVDGSVGASSYTTTSDKKLKENIEDIPIELIDKILEINIKSFNFIDDPKKIVQYGLIAQELEEIEKELKAINIDVKLVNTDDYRNYFDSEDKIDKFLKEKPYLEAKKSSEKYTVKEKYFVFNGKEYKTQEEAQKAEGVLKEGQLSKIEKKQRDVEKTKYTASWIQKAVNYNNYFSLKLSVVNDLISQNKAKKEFFFINDIDKVVRDKYNKTLEVLTKDNDLIKPFKESDNTLYKRVLAWLERSPDNQIIDKIYTKDEIIVIVKEKNNKKIRTFNNKVYSKTEWLQKSQNYQDIIARFTSQSIVKNNNGKITGREITQEECDNAIKAIERKDKYVSYYHKVLKPYIQKTSIEELQNILNMNEEEFFNIKL